MSHFLETCIINYSIRLLRIYVLYDKSQNFTYITQLLASVAFPGHSMPSQTHSPKYLTPARAGIIVDTSLLRYGTPA